MSPAKFMAIDHPTDPQYVAGGRVKEFSIKRIISGKGTRGSAEPALLWLLCDHYQAIMNSYETEQQNRELNSAFPAN